MFCENWQSYGHSLLKRVNVLKLVLLAFHGRFTWHSVHGVTIPRSRDPEHRDHGHFSGVRIPLLIQEYRHFSSNLKKNIVCDLFRYMLLNLQQCIINITEFATEGLLYTVQM